MCRTSHDFVTTFRTKESTYSNIRHIVVFALTRRGWTCICDCHLLSSSSNPSGHRQPTLGGRLHTFPKYNAVFSRPSSAYFETTFLLLIMLREDGTKAVVLLILPRERSNKQECINSFSPFRATGFPPWSMWDVLSVSFRECVGLQGQTISLDVPSLPWRYCMEWSSD